jgi:hypothetical protein
MFVAILGYDRTVPPVTGAAPPIETARADIVLETHCPAT